MRRFIFHRVTQGDIRDDLRPRLLLIDKHLKSENSPSFCIFQTHKYRNFFFPYLQPCHSSHKQELVHQTGVWHGSRRSDTAVMAAVYPEFRNMCTLRKEKKGDKLHIYIYIKYISCHSIKIKCKSNELKQYNQSKKILYMLKEREKEYFSA